jgi:hypothetical protein
MIRPRDFETLAAEAIRRSGRPDFIEYPAEAAGTSVVVCRLGDDDQRAFIDGRLSQDKGVRGTSKKVALSKARLWPEQSVVNAACETVPGLDDKLLQQVERLGGGDTEFLRVVEVRNTLDDSAIAELGIEPAVIKSLRTKYPHEGQLKIACYRDDELEIAWSCVLKLPGDRAKNLMLEGLHERGHETVTTFAVNCVVWPERDAAASFVRGEYRIAPCLWPALYAWAQTAAIARPTIWRPKSIASATSTAAQTSSPKSSATSE